MVLAGCVYSRAELLNLQACHWSTGCGHHCALGLSVRGLTTRGCYGVSESGGLLGPWWEIDPVTVGTAVAAVKRSNLIATDTHHAIKPFISVGHFNADSICNKTDDIFDHAKDSDLGILIILLMPQPLKGSHVAPTPSAMCQGLRGGVVVSQSSSSWSLICMECHLQLSCLLNLWKLN